MTLKYLPKPDEFHKYWYIDIETELIPAEGPKGIKTIWMMCASRLDSDEVISLVGADAITKWFEEHADDFFVGHNIVSFDGPVSARVAGGKSTLANSVDTLVLSYLYNPAIPGGHSLEAWGERYRFPKGNFHDFSAYSQEMDEYCQQDVRLGKKVFKGLVSRMLQMGFSEMSCWIEHHIRDVVNEQQEHGWYFDIPGAQALVAQLRAEQAELEGPILKLFPPRLADGNTYNRRKKADGTDFASYIRHVGQYPEIRDNGDGTYTVRDWEVFNIGSPAQRVSRLLELGYVPTSFTPKTEKGGGGNPKVDEESLVAFASESGRPAVQAIAEWLVLQGRASMVEGWLNNVNYDDHRMHGRVMTCAATTRRMIHNSPNTANIPKAKAKVKYGIECRRLWQAAPGFVQVGYDASGLEMRMFAEYLKNDEATALFTTGDPHMLNTRNLGFEDHMRDLTVKNGFYAYLYGAQDAKLGQTLKPELSGRAAKEFGTEAREILEKGTPGLARLVAEIKDEYKANGGVLRTIDGGFVRCTSDHAALNYKLQSAGSIVMKMAAIIVRDEIRKAGLTGKFVGNIHDEGQLECNPDHAEQIGRICVEAIAEAGRRLGFKVPLTGDFKIGANWAECH